MKMYKLYDCPDNVKDCLVSLTGFIRKGFNIMPYDDLLKKFSDGTGMTDDGNSYRVATDGSNKEFFDFDYGCVGGTFSNDDGAAHLDCLQYYYYNSETDETEVYDLNILI